MDMNNVPIIESTDGEYAERLKDTERIEAMVKRLETRQAGKRGVNITLLASCLMLIHDGCSGYHYDGGTVMWLGIVLWCIMCVMVAIVNNAD